jgi:hypothetical protein
MKNNKRSIKEGPFDFLRGLAGKAKKRPAPATQTSPAITDFGTVGAKRAMARTAQPTAAPAPATPSVPTATTVTEPIQRVVTAPNPAQKTNAEWAQSAGFASVADWYNDINKKAMSPDPKVAAQAQVDLRNYKKNAEEDRAELEAQKAAAQQAAQPSTQAAQPAQTAQPIQATAAQAPKLSVSEIKEAMLKLSQAEFQQAVRALQYVVSKKTKPTQTQPGKQQEPISIGGQKLDPNNPKDAKLIAQISAQPNAPTAPTAPTAATTAPTMASYTEPMSTKGTASMAAPATAAQITPTKVKATVNATPTARSPSEMSQADYVRQFQQRQAAGESRVTRTAENALSMFESFVANPKATKPKADLKQLTESRLVKKSKPQPKVAKKSVILESKTSNDIMALWKKMDR